VARRRSTRFSAPSPQEAQGAARASSTFLFKESAPLGGFMDGCSSAIWFDGWTTPHGAQRAIGLRRAGERQCPVMPPRTWLLRVGWRRHGLIDPNGARHAAGEATKADEA
jgi:hypothetical protein